MQPDIKTIMGKVLALHPGARSATVWIERPLQAGIQIEAGVTRRGGDMEYVVVENDEDFMAYVGAYKSANPWNRMKIKLNKKGKVVVEVSFDEGLEKDALEKTK